MSSDLLERTGPTLRTLAGIADAPSETEARRRLVAFLCDLADELPGDLSLAFRAGLALHEDVQHRFLEQRMVWLATKLDRDVRTARRRVDEAIRSAETLRAISVPSHDGYALDGWYLERFRALLYLDGAQPTAIEERKYVARHDFLSEVILSTSVPCPAGADPERHSANLTILYGGSLARVERPSNSYFRYFVRLPQPLRRGQSHEIGVSVTTPGDQPINPRYALQPLRRCDEFDLRIRFGAENRLTRVWNLAGVPRGMADDFAAASAHVSLDDAGEIHLNYQRLQVGLVYGARWEMVSSTAAAASAGAGAPALSPAFPIDQWPSGSICLPLSCAWLLLRPSMNGEPETCLVKMTQSF